MAEIKVNLWRCKNHASQKDDSTSKYNTTIQNQRLRAFIRYFKQINIANQKHREFS